MLLGSLAFVSALGCGAVRIGPDTYWQIATGHWILVHGYVPTHDIFSFTRHGALWVAQEWAEEVLVAIIYAVSGWSGLTLVAALAFALAIAYLARFLLVRMEPLHAVVLAVFSGCMMFDDILVRPYVLAWPLTVLWAGILVDSSEKNRTPPWWSLGVMVLWTNVHGSFILGLGLAGLIAVEAVLNAGEHWRSAARNWGVFVLATFGCALLNPQGWRLLVFPFHLLGMHVLEQSTEWRAPNLQRPQVFGLWLLAMFTLGFAGRFRLPWVRSVLVIGLMFFALQHVRNVSLFGLLVPILIAGPLGSVWRTKSGSRRDVQSLDRFFNALAAPGRMTALLCVLALASVLGIVAVRMREVRPFARNSPRAALNALLARAPHGRIFDDAGFGGYLIFRGVPVFVDPRMTVYGDSFLRRYFSALELDPNGNINALLRKYRISEILLAPEWPVVSVLDRSPDWKRIYKDKLAYAYIRREAVKPPMRVSR